MKTWNSFQKLGIKGYYPSIGLAQKLVQIFPAGLENTNELLANPVVWPSQQMNDINPIKFKRNV